MSLRDPALIGISRERSVERLGDSLRRVSILERRPGGGGGGGGAVSGEVVSGTTPGVLTSNTSGKPQWASAGFGVAAPTTSGYVRATRIGLGIDPTVALQISQASGATVAKFGSTDTANHTIGQMISSAVGKGAYWEFYETTTKKAEVGWHFDTLYLVVHQPDKWITCAYQTPWSGTGGGARYRFTVNAIGLADGTAGAGRTVGDTVSSDNVTAADGTYWNVINSQVLHNTQGSMHNYVANHTAYESEAGWGPTWDSNAKVLPRSVSLVKPGTVGSPVTATGHGLVTGDIVWMADVMASTGSSTPHATIDGRPWRITKIDDDNFTLDNIGTPGGADITGQGQLQKLPVHASITGITTGGVVTLTAARPAGWKVNDFLRLIATGNTDFNQPLKITVLGPGADQITVDATSASTGTGGVVWRPTYKETAGYLTNITNDSIGALTTGVEWGVYTRYNKHGRVCGNRTVSIETNLYDSYGDVRALRLYGTSIWPNTGTMLTWIDNQGPYRAGTAIMMRGNGGSVDASGAAATSSAFIRAMVLANRNGAELWTLDGLGQMGFGVGVTRNQTDSIPARITFSDTTNAAGGIQFGITSPIIQLYRTTDSLFCSHIFDADTLRISGTAGAGYLRFKEQSSAPGTPSAGQTRLYAEADGAGTKLSFKDDAGVVKVLQTTGATSTPEFLRVGIGQPATSTALSFLAATAATGGIAFGSDINLYRSAANDLTFSGTVSPRLIFQQASGATVTDPGLGLYVDTDPGPRVRLTYDGKIWFGNGSATPTVELGFGISNVLYTPDSFGIAQTAAPVGAGVTSGTGFVFAATGIQDVMRNTTGVFYRVYGSTAEVVATPAFRMTIASSNVALGWSAVGGNSIDTVLTRTGVGILQTTQFSATSGVLGGIGGTTAATGGLDTATTLVTRRSAPGFTTGNNNDVAITTSFVSCSGTTAGIVMTGFAGGVNGRWLTLHNLNTQSIQVNHEDGNSSAANRLWLKGAANQTITTQGAMEFVYDTTAGAGTGRWVEVNRNL